MSQPGETTGQWLEQIPRAWDVFPAKALFSERREPCHSDDVHLTPSQAYGVLPQEEYMAVTGSRVVLNLAGQDNMKHVEPDDFIIHLRSFQGGLERSALRGKVSTAYTVLSPRLRANADYYRWLLKSTAYIQTLRTTTNQLRDGQSIKFGDFAKVALPAPPPDVQHAIAAFLDREVDKIDALVAEQEGLVAVLRERRSAVIARATGWGDAVPEHWGWHRISWLFGSTGSGTTPAPEDIVEPSDEAVPWVTTGELREMPIASTRKAVPRDALASYSALKVHPAGSLAIAMYGATIGRLGMLAIPAATNQACCVMSSPRNCIPQFAQYSLMAARPWLLLDAAGGGQPNINQDKVRAFRLPVPPVDEQRQIVQYLDEQTEKVDALIGEAEGIAAVAKERRSALITAAVTGQIDVRGEVA